jgi:hypothetical protein
MTSGRPRRNLDPTTDWWIRTQHVPILINGGRNLSPVSGITKEKNGAVALGINLERWWACKTFWMAGLIRQTTYSKSQNGTKYELFTLQGIVFGSVRLKNVFFRCSGLGVRILLEIWISVSGCFGRVFGIGCWLLNLSWVFYRLSVLHLFFMISSVRRREYPQTDYQKNEAKINAEPLIPR